MKDSKYRMYVAAVDKALKNFEYTSEWADLIAALGKLNKARAHSQPRRSPIHCGRLAGADKLHEISCDTSQNKNKQASGAMHAPGAAIRSSSESPGNIRYHIQVHGNYETVTRTIHLQCWYVFVFYRSCC